LGEAMSENRNDAGLAIFPPNATPGALTAFIRPDKVQEVKKLEEERTPKTWGVRAYLSDHALLAGNPFAAIEERGNHSLLVNPKENPLWIYLHSGGRRAVYYGLFNGPDGKLDHIVVKVHSTLPSNALLLARGPINALLDVLVRDHPMPLLIHRLELLSPTSGDVLISECLMPQDRGVVMGPLGGIVQAVPFAPYDALYREALVSPSPFYRLICGWKMYEGTDKVRALMRKECETRKVPAKLPPDPAITSEDPFRFGFAADFAEGITCARDLFEKLRETRNAISHFLIDTDEGEAGVYVADGAQLRHYSMSAAAMLHYSHQALDELRLFSVKIGIHFWTRGSMVLPMPQNRDQFPILASDYGTE
jgi:hypothetical protein